MRTEIIVIILLMGLVTYVPRALPAVVVKYIIIQGRSEKFLKAIPYAAMGALIFPGILSVNQENPFIGIFGGVTALLLSWRKRSIICVIISSILVVVLAQLLISRI